MSYKILFSNIGYARGIDGSLRQHITRAGRHFYCEVPVQIEVLSQMKNIIQAEKPDLCCFVEIDVGSPHSAGFNQVQALIDDDYVFHDIASKYGEGKYISRMPLHAGKSNCFVSRLPIPFERLYFRSGTKRLIYSLSLPLGFHLFFAHFSLKRKVRERQFEEMRELVTGVNGRAVIMADFNVFGGFSELSPFLEKTGMVILNREEDHTFMFHRRTLALDLCLAPSSLVPHFSLRIIPQPFSDHDALLLDIHSWQE